VFECGRCNCEIKLFVAKLGCKSTPSTRNPDRQRQNAFAVSTQSHIEPISEILGKTRIEYPLTRDSKLNLADCHRTEKQVSLGNIADPGNDVTIPPATTQFR
jgi:hypothetical protein